MGDTVIRAQGRLAPLLLALLLVALAAALGAGAAGTGAGNEPPPDFSAYPWFYLRGGQPLGADETAIELIAVGDVMPGRGVARVEAPLARAAPWLQAADLTLGNLEAVLVAEAPAEPVDGRILLWAQPAAATLLAGAGFDLLGLANNHSLDAAAIGLAETGDHLRAAGVIPVGAGQGDAAYEPVYREVEGVRLAFLAFNTVGGPARDPVAPRGPDNWTAAQWDEARSVAAVEAARARADAVIVSMHWGYEYQRRPDPSQLRIVDALSVAGVALVLGHHPHLVQPVIVGEGRPDSVAALSLGNFLFDQEAEATREGLALRAFFDAEGLRAVQALPVEAGLRPRLLAVDEGEMLLARVAPPPGKRYFACSQKVCQQSDEPDGRSEQSGLFWSGTIDLTGDGLAELVRRAAGRVTVYDGVEPGDAVWQSPPAWNVVDVDLGDPNDDGRGELLLALAREDEAGHTRSQPFIVGYRGGRYQVLWGGRAVSAPILEVELGDVEGDGVQELVVLEARDEGTALALWRWQGWTFSLVWRSAPGSYDNLTLLPAGDGLLLAVDEHLH